MSESKFKYHPSNPGNQPYCGPDTRSDKRRRGRSWWAKLPGHNNGTSK